MLKRAIILAFMVAAVPARSSAESWLCIADLKTGFRFDTVSKEWRNTNFRVDANRFIVKPSTDVEWKFDVFEFGNASPFPEARCGRDFNTSGMINCLGFFGEFKFNKRNLRYVKTYIAGYVEIMPENKLIKEGNDTPLIEIGRCSPI